MIVVLAHAAGLALTIFTIVRSGDRPQVLIYWLEGLVAGTTVLDPDAPLEVNLGYNRREVRVLAVATLTAALVVVIRQAKRFSSSGWVLLGPLLAFRFLFDLSSALRSRAR